jgi:hypothetical protein
MRKNPDTESVFTDTAGARVLLVIREASPSGQFLNCFELINDESFNS